MFRQLTMITDINNSIRYSSRYLNPGRPDYQARYYPLYRDIQGQQFELDPTEPE